MRSLILLLLLGHFDVQSYTCVHKPTTRADANVSYSYVKHPDVFYTDAVHADPNVGLSLNDVWTVFFAMLEIMYKTCIKFNLTKNQVKGKPWIFISRDNVASNRSCQLDYIKDNLQGKDIAGLGDIYGQLDTDGRCNDRPYATCPFGGPRSPQNLFLGQNQNDKGHILHELVLILGGIGTGAVLYNEELTSGEVFRLNKIYCGNEVDGSWGEWSGYCSNEKDGISDCKRKKVRSCDSPAPKNGGNQCSGESEMVESCAPEETDPTNNPNCVLSGGWSVWSEVSTCSASCSFARTRTCTDPKPFNSKECEGDANETSACTGGDCGPGTSGEITSPDYPYIYPKNASQEITIFVPQGKKISLIVTDLQIEHPVQIFECNFDRLMIFDGPSQSAKKLLDVCRYWGEFTIVSTGNTMTVFFRSDADIEYNGFKANWKQI